MRNFAIQCCVPQNYSLLTKVWKRIMKYGVLTVQARTILFRDLFSKFSHGQTDMLLKLAENDTRKNNANSVSTGKSTCIYILVCWTWLLSGCCQKDGIRFSWKSSCVSALHISCAAVRMRWEHDSKLCKTAASARHNFSCWMSKLLIELGFNRAYVMHLFCLTSLWKSII